MLNRLRSSPTHVILIKQFSVALKWKKMSHPNEKIVAPYDQNDTQRLIRVSAFCSPKVKSVYTQSRLN